MQPIYDTPIGKPKKEVVEPEPLRVPEMPPVEMPEPEKVPVP